MAMQQKNKPSINDKKKKKKKKSVPKARTHQADNLAKLRHEFLPLPEPSQILCAVAVKKSSVALGVAYITKMTMHYQKK